MKSNKDNPVIAGELCSPSEGSLVELKLCSESGNELQVLYEQTVCTAARTLAKELENISPESLSKAKRIEFKFGYQLVPTLDVAIIPHD